MFITVEIWTEDHLMHEYTMNTADSAQNRVFQAQALNAMHGGQMVVTYARRYERRYEFAERETANG